MSSSRAFWRSTSVAIAQVLMCQRCHRTLPIPVLALIDDASAERLPKRDLANQHPWIDANPLDRVQLERPLIDRSQVDEVGRDVDEDAKTPHRRPPANDRHISPAPHSFFGVYEIK